MHSNIILTDTLPVMEHFYTIQGEGLFQGHPAYFVRLGGCDVGCVWCDVKESWDASTHPKLSIEKIISEIKATPAKIVVITGGEPLIHPLGSLTAALQLQGFKTHIETSGSSAFSGCWDWVCLSPKKFKPPLPEIFPLTNELKIIVYNQSDFKWGEDFAAKMPPHCTLFLQPEWSREKEMLPFIIKYIKQNPKWALSLQLHKYINVP